MDGIGRVGRFNTIVELSRVGSPVLGSPYMDLDIVLRRAVGVVATIDGGVPQVDLALCLGLRFSTDVDINLAEDLALAGVFSVAHAATEDVARQRAVEEFDSSDVGGLVVDATESRAAIDVAIDGRSIAASQVTDSHGDITRGGGCGTEAAAKDRGMSF